MLTSLTLPNLLAMASALVVLAALPSISVLTVVSRSASLGLSHGIASIVGVLLGDLIFILVALFGLSLLNAWLTPLRPALPWLAAIYLIVLGYQLWQATPPPQQLVTVPSAPYHSSLLAGLLITLADQKAIVFYLAFFPMFIQLEHLTLLDVVLIILITIMCVGGVKLIYAVVARRAMLQLAQHWQQRLYRLASLMLMGIGLSVLMLQV
ncbi:MAG: LysE family translocator [Pseudomonadota bacterium]|nr:LysE family translocator [Pseudomonadota bacterium]